MLCVWHVQWSVPLEPLDDFRESKLVMMPPQQYNLKMLASFTRIADLLGFVKQHQSCAVCSSPWLPQMVKCTDGIVLAFPGTLMSLALSDPLYFEFVKLTKPVPVAIMLWASMLH